MAYTYLILAAVSLGFSSGSHARFRQVFGADPASINFIQTRTTIEINLASATNILGLIIACIGLYQNHKKDKTETA